jgi:MATE family multidrug resistance protein
MSVTVANGIGAAATVRVGYYIGQRDTSSARRAGTVGLVVVGLVITLWSLIFVLFPRQLTMLFTHSETVIAAAVPLLMVAAVVQWSDGTQRVAASTLLGVGDTRVPLYVTIFGHYFVGIPVAYVLAFQAGIGVTGLAWGITVAYTIVALSLTVRFFRLSSRPIAPLL